MSMFFMDWEFIILIETFLSLFIIAVHVLETWYIRFAISINQEFNVCCLLCWLCFSLDSLAIILFSLSFLKFCMHHIPVFCTCCHVYSFPLYVLGHHECMLLSLYVICALVLVEWLSHQQSFALEHI